MAPPVFRNILIIKPGAIGDLVQMTPVIRALNRAYPEAKISLLVGSRQTAGLFTHNDAVHETLLYDRHNEHRSFAAFLRLWRSLRGRRYDLVINYQRSNVRTWLLVSAALPCRVLVYHKARNRTVHAVVNYLETLAPLGVDIGDTRLELRVGKEEEAYAESVLAGIAGSGPIIALNPGASHPVNRWPPERFAALADKLANALSARVLIIGGPDDIPLADAVREHAASKPVSLAGKAGLLQVAALLERAAVLVSGDTGPLHLATAVGTRTVALFGAADPARTGPIGEGHVVVRSEAPCAPCRSRTCGNPSYLECMERISVNEVFAAVRHALRTGDQI